MSSNIVIDENGKERLKSDIDFVDEILKLKNQHNQWAVIDRLLERWLVTDPDEVSAVQVQLEDHREMLTDKEFGSTAGGKDLERRFTLVFPIRLMEYIRTVYSAEELEFDSKFYRDFTKRYPQFRVAEKG